MKKITINYGDEYRAKIEKKFHKDDFFFEVYRKAHTIVREIEENTIKYEEEMRFNTYNRVCLENNNVYFENNNDYHKNSNNVIAFSSTRGQGKTSALHSFSRYLKRYCDDINIDGEEKLKKKYYVLSSAIDPSALNAGESAVRVLISRLFEDYVQYIDEQNSIGELRNMGLNSSEDRSEILELFRKCYNNIDFLVKKEAYDFEQDDLDYLSQLGNSSKLSENLQCLVNKLLHFYSNNNKVYNYLVIPIDDADLSIQHTFQLCEDIRKYFSAWNIIVLIASDFEQLERSIAQNYVKQYETLIRLTEDEQKGYLFECHKMAAKYIEKLFPPGHRIELPKIDEHIAGEADKLFLKYIKIQKDDGFSGEQIEDIFLEEKEKCKDLQEQITNIIYNRTGILFLNKEQSHPFFPVTLRELCHLIKILESLEKVDFSKAFKLDIKNGIKKSDTRELSILYTNISEMEHYFINYWCPNRLTEKHQRVMRQIYDAKKENKGEISFYVTKKYLNSKLKFEKTKYKGYLHFIFKQLQGFENDYDEKDLYNAIKIYFSIYLNKWFVYAWGNKKEMAEIADFIGHTFYIEQDKEELYSYRGYKIHHYTIDRDLFQKYILNSDTIKYGLGDWMQRFCLVQTKEGYPAFNKINLDDIQKNFDVIQSIDVNIFDLIINLLRYPEMLLDLKVQKSDVQKSIDEVNTKDKIIEQKDEEDMSEALELNGSEGDHLDPGILVNIKNIICNPDVQGEISSCIVRELEKYNLESNGEQALISINKNLYKNIDEWIKNYSFLNVSSNIVDYYNTGFVNSGTFLDLMFLCDKNNNINYIKELKNNVLKLIDDLLCIYNEFIKHPKGDDLESILVSIRDDVYIPKISQISLNQLSDDIKENAEEDELVQLLKDGSDLLLGYKEFRDNVSERSKEENNEFIFRINKIKELLMKKKQRIETLSDKEQNEQNT